MKALAKFRNLVALILLAGLPTIVVATEGTTVPVVESKEEDKDLSMELSVPSNIDTYVSVLDQEGNIVYDDNLWKNTKAGKTYDFSKVKDGVYTLIAKTEYKSDEKKFLICLNRPTLGLRRRTGFYETSKS